MWLEWFLLARYTSLLTFLFDFATHKGATTTTTRMTTTNTPRPKIQAILFDLDGTLLDTEALSDKAMIAFFRAQGLMADNVYHDLVQNHDGRLPWLLKKQLLGLRGSDWGPIAIRYAEQHWNVPVGAVTVHDIWTGWERHLNDMCHQVQACPGAAALVQALASLSDKDTMIPLAIATSSRRAAVTKKATHHGSMFQHFSTIVAGDHPAVKRGKPAPDIYFQAAQELGVEPSKCLVVEDALSGVQAGKAAGCIVVAVPDPRFDAQERAVFCTTADYVLDSLWDFDQVLLDLGLTIALEREQAKQPQHQQPSS